ncbi:HPr-rel-A system PqqD family peptide chaperone [Sphingomonas parva]|uniref:HPr-rel-A system PqqD family peptide chaperone n=1 Tax=Sphingomonas parva TaxID=2555898 RepID=A0A4Y8ZVQ6_9SPHN|nr:HPr-rel-A system PqqD family peptide chaperone [Sphingomonas parva]
MADPQALARNVALDGLTAIFHAPSGLTHLLAPPAPQILAALAGRPGSAEEVLARIAESFELEAANPADAIAARLAELEAVGLVAKT